ncbi:nitroreductase [Clostridia bacterium]|nr:nitroreductase [Clostridia bacterium]
MNDTLRALSARKSMRVFENRAIDPAVRAALLEAAFQAPTAGNQMLYTIIDATDPALKAALAEQCDHQPFIATAPLVLIFLADCRRWLDTYRAAGLAPRRPGQGDILLATADAVIAAQNVVVAAESYGLGSCYIGDILEHCEDIRALLSLPEEVLPAAMLVIGYPTPQQQARKKPARFDGRFIVFENAYRTLTPQEHRAMYLERAARDGRADADFEAQMEAFWKRKYESDFSREMSRSAAVYLRAFAPTDQE